jgi:hypothetical protein
MSYAVEWVWGPVAPAMVLLFLIVPGFAVIAVVVATIAVLVVALAAIVALVALAAAALATPYLLMRMIRRRLAQRRTRWIHAPSAMPQPIARRIARGSAPSTRDCVRSRGTGRGGRAILEDATRDPA